MKRKRLLCAGLTTVCLSLLLAAAAQGAELRLSRYFSDNMVLQREKPVSVWGVADAGETVTVRFAEQSKTASAGDDGRWTVELDPIPAVAEGQELVAAAKSGRVVLNNVLVGDVWFHGRQSYVDISLGRNAEGQAAAAKYTPSGNFRAMVIQTIPAKEPRNDLHEDATAGWVEVDRQNALQMSGSAFYLGKDLARDLEVPIGIVDVNMDRYFGIGWLSEKAIANAVQLHPEDKEIDWLPAHMQMLAEERDSGKAQKELDEYWEERSRGRPDSEKPSLGLHPLNNPMYPSAGYNAVINPLKHITVKGVLLQLGNDYPFIPYRELEKQGRATVKVELDAAWGVNYPILKNGYRVTSATLPYVPGDWRQTFDNKELPVGLILPPASDLDVYAAHNREIRELHRRTSEESEGIGLILPGMENLPFSGQPVDDKLLAERCRQWVLGAVLNKDNVTATGPVLDRMEARLSKATVYFKDGTAEGLKAKGDALDSFETAGLDRQFTPAGATIDGATIKINSDSPIRFVRYNWTDKPGPGLVNSAGLPALPFNTDDNWHFGWIPPPEKADLPKEYRTTADKWSKSDIAIINGQIASMASGDSAPIPRRPGPIGIVSAPFGPNVLVTGIDPGTPAEGKILPGDVIYGVNGKIFEDGPEVSGDAKYFDLADAITFSESEAGEGKLVLSLRRGTKLMDVDLQLEVLGAYSATTPYYCEKSAAIVKNAEEWSAKQYRPESGLASQPTGMLQTDLLFLMASGTPKQQGLVRRAVYKMMENMRPLEPVTPGERLKPWHSGHGALLLGEYYHATGDRNVLPYLKRLADEAAMSQLKPRAETPEGIEAAHSEEQVGGWRHNYPTAPDRWKSGYGLLPHAGMSCVMGMQLGKEAGLDIDELALERGLEHFNKGRAEYGFVLYSYSNLRREGPPAIDPAAEAKGKLWSMNGKLGMAAALYNMLEGYDDSVEICARHCVYGYNNTRHGHGGMFFNNFWTPVGAWAGGEKAFTHFMKGQQWWRELFRRSDGAFNQVGRGGVGVSYGLPYVAQKQRLRLLGAPKSAFGTNCPKDLKPALEAHRKRDYELCERLIREQIAGVLPAEDMPVVNHLLESVQTLRASIAHDLDYTENLVEDGKFYYASLELPQLRGVVAEDSPRLQAIVQALESPEGRAKIKGQRRVRLTEERALRSAQKAAQAPADNQKWFGLVEPRDEQEAGDVWRMRLVEHISQAPEDWTDPRFDDGDWNVATLPLSWCPYHTALFRSSFTIDDKDAIDGLRVLGKFFQQTNVVVYLNGEVVAKVDQLGRGIGTTNVTLTDYALKMLKKGENTVAISSRHKRRWGPFRGKYKTAATVSFRVEGSMRETEK